MACHVCRSPERFVFRKEQNVSCGDYFAGSRLYGDDLGQVDLLECVACGFGTFPHMRDWPEQRFRDEIYNEAYSLCDRPFIEDRPRKLAAWIAATFQPCRLLDFGGGNGVMASLLGNKGFDASHYDPFYGDTRPPVDGADVVTAFEVVEHVPDQAALFAALRALCNPGGLIVFSTLLKAQRSEANDWWYASARNGHVSFHTTDSLARIAQACGLHTLSLSRELHLAAREPAVLKAAAGWPVLAINGRPAFAFREGWAIMMPV